MENHILSVSHVSKFFGGLKANLDVSFSLNYGEILGLIGPNGAGKTTLFNCLTGFYQASEGDVVFRNQRINGLKPDAICKRGMARTWQKVKPLPDMSILNNVVVGALCRTNNMKKASDIAHQTLSVVGLDGLADQLAGSLSIGNKKLLELARTLATEPKLILLDEICGGLNSVETEKVLHVIKSLPGAGISVLFIEHDMRAVNQICDRIVCLNSGELLAAGTCAEVLSNQNVIDAYLGTTGENNA